MATGIYASYLQHFPPEIQGDPEWQLFAALMDGIDDDIRDSITEIGDFYDVEKCPDYLLDKLAYCTGAPVFKADSDFTKRVKIKNAIRYHREKGTIGNIEEMVEHITGITPEFTTFGSTYSAYFIWESLENLSPAPNNFAKWASENNFSAGGLMWGSQASSGVLERFVVYMDIKIPNPSSLLLGRIVKSVEYFGAAYFRWHIGYGSPGWVSYAQVN